MNTILIKILWTVLLYAAFLNGSAYATDLCLTKWAANGCSSTTISSDNRIQIQAVLKSQINCLACSTPYSEPCCLNCACYKGTTNLEAVRDTSAHFQPLLYISFRMVFHPGNRETSISLFPSEAKGRTGRQISILNQSLIC